MVSAVNPTTPTNIGRMIAESPQYLPPFLVQIPQLWDRYVPSATVISNFFSYQSALVAGTAVMDVFRYVAIVNNVYHCFNKSKEIYNLCKDIGQREQKISEQKLRRKRLVVVKEIDPKLRIAAINHYYKGPSVPSKKKLLDKRAQPITNILEAKKADIVFAAADQLKQKLIKRAIIEYALNPNIDELMQKLDASDLASAYKALMLRFNAFNKDGGGCISDANCILNLTEIKNIVTEKVSCPEEFSKSLENIFNYKYNKSIERSKNLKTEKSKLQFLRNLGIARLAFTALTIATAVMAIFGFGLPLWATAIMWLAGIAFFAVATYTSSYRDIDRSNELKINFN